MNPTMNPKMKWLYVSLAVLLLLTGVVVYKAVSGSRTAPAPAEEEEILEGEQILELLNIEKKRPRTHKEVDITPVEQPQQNLQFINKENGKK